MVSVSGLLNFLWDQNPREIQVKQNDNINTFTFTCHHSPALHTLRGWCARWRKAAAAASVEMTVQTTWWWYDSCYSLDGFYRCTAFQVWTHIVFGLACFVCTWSGARNVRTSSISHHVILHHSVRVLSFAHVALLWMIDSKVTNKTNNKQIYNSFHNSFNSNKKSTEMLNAILQ